MKLVSWLFSAAFFLIVKENLYKFLKCHKIQFHMGANRNRNQNSIARMWKKREINTNKCVSNGHMDQLFQLHLLASSCDRIFHFISFVLSSTLCLIAIIKKNKSAGKNCS